MNTVQFDFFGRKEPENASFWVCWTLGCQNQTDLTCFMAHWPWCFVITLIFSLFIIGCALPPH